MVLFFGLGSLWFIPKNLWPTTAVSLRSAWFLMHMGCYKAVSWKMVGQVCIIESYVASQERHGLIVHGVA